MKLYFFLKRNETIKYEKTSNFVEPIFLNSNIPVFTVVKVNDQYRAICSLNPSISPPYDWPIDFEDATSLSLHVMNETITFNRYLFVCQILFYCTVLFVWFPHGIFVDLESTALFIQKPCSDKIRIRWTHSATDTALSCAHLF